MRKPFRRLAGGPHRPLPILVALAALAVSLPFAPLHASAQDRGRGTGLPLPRFVSLKSDAVNVRRGPGQEYGVAFKFVKDGLPVEITEEFDNWRKIRDSEGDQGWVFHSLLSGKRTALVTPWETHGDAGPFPVLADPDKTSAVVAYLEPKVLADVAQCRDGWCEVSGQGYSGWIEQDRLWGVYPNEDFKG